MAIVSSTYAVEQPQIDGRRYVNEMHTDHLGNVYRIGYGPVPDTTDYAAVCAARAVELEQALADAEAAQVIG